MAEQDPDALNAERQYLLGREIELRAKLRDQLEALFGTGDISPDTVTPELIEAVCNHVIDLLGQTGQTALAGQYREALDRWGLAHQEQRELNERLGKETSEEGRSMTDGELKQLNALRNAASEALEHYERVAADVRAGLNASDPSADD